MPVNECMSTTKTIRSTTHSGIGHAKKNQKKSYWYANDCMYGLFK
jgi:hypothetical protein